MYDIFLILVFFIVLAYSAFFGCINFFELKRGTKKSDCFVRHEQSLISRTSRFQFCTRTFYLLYTYIHFIYYIRGRDQEVIAQVGLPNVQWRYTVCRHHATYSIA